MLVDRYQAEDVFARVPQMAQRIDPVLKELDQLLDDDALYQQVRADFGQRHRYTLVHGRHSTPAEVLLRLLVVQHLYAWSYAETLERVADQSYPPALGDRVALLAKQAKVTQARKLRIDSTCVLSYTSPSREWVSLPRRVT